MEYAENALVSTDWVAERLDDAGTRIIEVEGQPAGYVQGHLPGAVFLPYANAFMMPRDGVPMQIPTPEVMENVLRQAGITPEMTIVVYGDYNSKAATRALWVLRAYGHQTAYLMDGGRRRWLDEDRPLATDMPELALSEYGNLPAPDGDERATWEAVQAAIDDPNVVLLDVRRLTEYTGQERQALRGGRIPGAVHLPWEEALTPDGGFRENDDLRAAFEVLGVTPDKTIITYCQGGVRATHSWFVLKYLLGYPSVKNYDGSWAEWGNRPDLPIEP